MNRSTSVPSASKSDVPDAAVAVATMKQLAAHEINTKSPRVPENTVAQAIPAPKKEIALSERRVALFD
jgi:hypothetical protein